MKKRITLLFVLSCAVSAHAARLSQTTELQPGMTPSEVRAVMGAPSATSLIGDKLIWKYELSEFNSKFAAALAKEVPVPFIAVFSAAKLDSWYFDDQDLARRQDLNQRSQPQKRETTIRFEEKE